MEAAVGEHHPAPFPAEHDEPAPEKIEALREFLHSLDISLPRSGTLNTTHFNGVLARVKLDETKAAMRLLAEKARVIAEGAGALSVAAAMRGLAGDGPVVAVVSGGNIDLKKFCELVS